MLQPLAPRATCSPAMRPHADARAALGFEYVDNEQVLQLPIEGLLNRLEALVAKGVGEPVNRAALLGTEKRPAFPLSKLFEEFEQVVAEEIKDLSPEQLRIWRNGRIRAVAQFVDRVGDKPVTDVTHDDALDYVDWWRGRIVSDDALPKTANKDIGQLSRMLKDVSVRRRLNIPEIFKGLRLRGEIEKSRVPYETKFIQDRLLAAGALDGLNEDARHVLYVVADTGLRPSEVVNLTEAAICLDAAIPHVKITAGGPPPEDGGFRAGDSAGRRGAGGDAAASEGLPALPRQVFGAVVDAQQVLVGERAAPDEGSLRLFACVTASATGWSVRKRRTA